MPLPSTDFLDVPLARILRANPSFAPEGASTFAEASADRSEDKGVKTNPNIPGIETIHLLRAKDALALKRQPKTMAIIGAGSAGCELATLFASIGTRVLLVETAATVLPREDAEMGAIVGRRLVELGVEVATGAEILEAINATGAVYGLRVRCGGTVETHALEAVVFATDADEAGPRVTLASPEVATVGLTAAEAKEKFGGALVGRCEVSTLGRAIAERSTAGLFKVVAHPKTRKVVGCQIVADRAGETIHEAALAIDLGATVERLASMVHAASTWSEGIAKAAAAVSKKRD